MDDTEGDAESDGLSAFSFSIYDIDFGEREIERPLSPTPSGAFSRSSFATQGQELELDDATFELDYQFRLPPSIPGTPLDLETWVWRNRERKKMRISRFLSPLSSKLKTSHQPRIPTVLMIQCPRTSSIISIRPPSLLILILTSSSFASTMSRARERSPKFFQRRAGP